jgi:hypothetical protein
MQEPGAELVLVAVAILLDEAVRLQRLEQAVDRGPGELEAVGDLADAEPARAGREELEDPRRAVDGLDHAAVSDKLSLFDIVESLSEL